MTYAALTADQIASVREFARMKGRRWKEEARLLWQSADISAAYSADWRAVLTDVYALRNSHGPSWLNSFRLETPYTLAQLKDAASRYGLGVRLRESEYRIAWPDDEDSAYYTDDSEDPYRTIFAMGQRTALREGNAGTILSDARSLQTGQLLH